LKGRPLSWTCEHGARRPLCSASGLAAAGRRFWLVGDDLQHAVELGAGRGRRLFAGDLPRGAKARKAAKRDLESLIALPDGRLLAFPSGSKDCRTRGAVITVDRAGRFVSSRTVELGALLRRLGERVPGLNVEGGFVEGRELVLLQRGNGRRRVDAELRLPLRGFLAALDGARPWPRAFRVRRVALGEWDGVPLSFTDGFAWRSGALVSLAAERTHDPVHDGEVKGSVIGRLRRGRFTPLLRLPGLKVEGLALLREGRRALSLLAVTDADDRRRPSLLLRLRVAVPA
jgi:hypothetical protein